MWLIRTLNLGHRKAGFYIHKGEAACWDGRDDLNRKVSSGVYLYELQAGKSKDVKRLVILK
jgi:hypothetical protein